jgi:predicted lipoprotein with Yx(FWY)xxD motif
MLMTTKRTATAGSVTARALLVAAILGAFAITLIHVGTSTAAPARGPVVSTATTGLGRTLVNAQGRTLYLFQRDKQGRSTCSGACATNWPPLIATAKPVAGSEVKASLIGTTKRADGRLQVTYNHHPLYLFIKDAKKGQTSGEGIDAFGANWYAISPAGTALKKASSSSSGGTPGYGY